eukprot:TRINITY_DN7024_c0_g1_i22.p1 TRINITY_DN7024_c0_g1~~TRINITY_DN7024_c0_g1_i22.p1  ORF type:complete len:225 (-),score=37.46 TRINITY_DN7024_c0_g1_i22:1080-1754(-)
MKVTLKLSAESSTDLDWNFTEDYTITGHRKYLKIHPEVTCSLKGKVETFFVTFLDRNLFKDYYQNSLGVDTISAPSVRMIQIPNAVSQAGDAFNTINYISLIITLLLAGKSNPAFWVFLGAIQMISYVPLLHCAVPRNLETFIKEYFGVSKVSIPFDSFPEWVPNPTNIVKSFVIEHSNSRALEAGYESVCFLYNFGSQLFTWVTTVLIYTVFILVSKLSIKKL